MSKLNDVLEEMSTRLLQLNAPPVDLTGRVVVAYNEDDLIDVLKGIRNFPAVGIVYEGMRSLGEQGSTAKMGLSCEGVFGVVLVERSDEIHASIQKKTRAIDYLEVMRNQFLGHKSTATGHFWKFMVESPAALKSGTVCWVQRWGLPIQLRPTPPAVP